MGRDAREQFEKFLNGGASVDRVLDAARNVADLDLNDALRITNLMATLHDNRYDRAAAKLAARIILERGLTIEQAASAIVAAAELPDLDAQFELSTFVNGPPRRTDDHRRPFDRY